MENLSIKKKYKQSLIERFFERYPATNNIRFSMKILRAPERGGFNNIINAEYCGCWGAQNVCDLCRCRGNRISFFIRVSPGPNNALTVAAYSGQKDSSCSF